MVKKIIYADPTIKKGIVKMDKLRKYQERKALAEANYITRLNESKRMAGEAFTEYQKELSFALKEYQQK